MIHQIKLLANFPSLSWKEMRYYLIDISYNKKFLESMYSYQTELKTFHGPMYLVFFDCINKFPES